MADKITIFDVARKAGVSKGTVDRVLHNRGEVSRKSAEKVRKAISDLGYEPNIYASLLATRNAFVIACLIPEFSRGDYWSLVNDGFIQAGDQVRSLNVRVRVFYYNQYDPESFRDACSALWAERPSGVIMAPLFKADTEAFARRLSAAGIPFIYVDDRVGDGYLAYLGMPRYDSGRLCAALLTERAVADDLRDVAIVRINRDKFGQSDPSAERRSGFMDFMSANFPGCAVSTVFINPSDPVEAKAELEAFFSQRPDVRNVVMFNSRVYLLGEYLKAHPQEDRRVIGYDNLERNLELLRDGHVTCLISEKAESQSRKALELLADYILMRKQPSKRDNFLHMDILTRFNIDNY